MHVVDERRVVILDDGEHIDVVDGGADDDRACAVFLKQQVLALDHLGLLELQFRSHLLHLLHQVVTHLLGVAIENLPNGCNVLPILVNRHQTLTTSLTVVDVILQA